MAKGSVYEGKTVDEAVSKGLEDLGLDRAEATITVVEEGKGGFLGFGSRPYRVSVMRRPGGPVREPEEQREKRVSSSRRDDRRGGRGGRDRDREGQGQSQGGRGGRREERKDERRTEGRKDEPRRDEPRRDEPRREDGRRGGAQPQAQPAQAQQPAPARGEERRGGRRDERRGGRRDEPREGREPRREPRPGEVRKPQPAEAAFVPEADDDEGVDEPMTVGATSVAEDAEGGAEGQRRRRRRGRRGGRGRRRPDEADSQGDAAPEARFERPAPATPSAPAAPVAAIARQPEPEPARTGYLADVTEMALAPAPVPATPRDVEQDTRSDGGDRPARAERRERPDRPERPERRDRPERPDRPERSDRTEHGGREAREGQDTEPVLAAGELAETSRRVTLGLLEAMGFEATVTVSAEGNRADVTVEVADDDELLTGQKGEVRQAMQHLLNRFINRGEGSRYHLQLEINDFWQRREAELATLAHSLAEEAIANNAEAVTEYLNSQERRIVHVTLREDTRVKTYALGTGLIKRVAVAPADFPERTGEE